MSVPHPLKARVASRRRSIQPVLLVLLLSCSLFIAACNPSPQSKSNTPQPTSQVQQPGSAPVYGFPALDANYIYDQLYYLSTTFQQRESGFDTVEQNGHAGFAQYWVQEMLSNLRGFGAQVTYDYFRAGWISRTGVSSSYNVEVTIPGAVHPDQVVVIGSHYDGMHVSQGSAFDDTSGCAIMLGEARALGEYWRTHHLYPARTVRFVIFDAEEEGIWGSHHYIDSTINGDLTNVVALFNEEQSGLSYPVRFLGKAANPLIPLRVANVNIVHAHLPPSFSSLLSEAVPVVAQEMREQGYTSLPYQGSSGQAISEPVFTPDQIKEAVIQGDSVEGSDNLPFEQASIPAMTFISGEESDLSSHDPKKDPPTNIPANEFYPFDTHYDTIQLLNDYATGATSKSEAVALALDFEALIQAWMFDQPALVGTFAVNRLAPGPLTAISDIGITRPGTPLKLDARSSFDPLAPTATLSFKWDFGDGSQATGISVQHTYALSGKYVLTLTVTDARGAHKVSKTLLVTNNSPGYANLVQPYLQMEATSHQPLAMGDNAPPSGYRFPPIIHNGDGLTSADHFPGHDPEPAP